MVARSLEPKGRPETPLGRHPLALDRPPPPGARGQKRHSFGAAANPERETPSLVPRILIANFEPGGIGRRREASSGLIATSRRVTPSPLGA